MQSNQSSARFQRHPLDAPVWSSLTGEHARFAQGSPPALRYPGIVSPWMALEPGVDAATAWVALSELAAPGDVLALSSDAETIKARPPGWDLTLDLPGVQMVATDAFVSGPDAEAALLGDDDVPEMLDLVALTQPGPFAPQTNRLGRYLGIRSEGALVAMAGERLHPTGWTEISAVCTHPAYRGQGLAARLIRAVADGIRARGETPFLHTAAQNLRAIRLYQALGFELRREVTFFAVVAPGAGSGAE